MSQNIDVESLSDFVRQECALIMAGLVAQTWGTNTLDFWKKNAYKKMFVFCAQDSEGLEFRKQAIMHERHLLVARCQRYDRFHAGSQDELSKLRATITLDYFLKSIATTALLFTEEHRQTMNELLTSNRSKISY